MRSIVVGAAAVHTLVVVVSSFQPCPELSAPRFDISSSSAARLGTSILAGRRPKALSASAVSASSDEDQQRALALSDYLAKAHEEKLRAIQAVEKKKAAEIQALQDELQQLKAQQSAGQRPSGGAAGALTMASSGAYVGAEDLMSLPKDVLASKVVQYQRFMEKYIVEAQEQKYRAVKAAEDSLRKKFVESQQLALGPSPVPAAPLASPPATSAETTLYQARSAAVAKAAAAGQSRWGDMEVQRAGSVVNVGAAILSPSSVAVLDVPPEVEAADHGIKADGSLSLAERVARGVNAGAVAVAQAASVSRTAITSPSAATSLYEKRNARVLAAAAAGASRWGSMEVERVRSLASLPSSRASTAPVAAVVVPSAVVPPEVVAADHGLRSDGSVGGPTLAERIAQGAGASSGSAVSAPSAGRPAILSLYDRRNIRVLESAAAGKSRWGSREVDRVRELANHLLSPGGSSAPQPLAGRVNLGAQLLQKK